MTLPELIGSVGYFGVFVMVFLESGVPIGAVLPLPGDTLLFSAGILAAAKTFNLLPLLAVIVTAAILGDSAGYWFGFKFGRRLFKADATFLNIKHLDRTERFYDKYGSRAIVLGRFIPLLRTLVPIFAGIGKMNYTTFIRYNIAGAFIWGVSVTVLGYYLGKLIPNIDTYLLPILALIILATSGSAVWEIYKVRKEKTTS
jgi:membrane-associated protein